MRSLVPLVATSILFAAASVHAYDDYGFDEIGDISACDTVNDMICQGTHTFVGMTRDDGTTNCPAAPDAVDVIPIDCTTNQYVLWTTAAADCASVTSVTISSLTADKACYVKLRGWDGILSVSVTGIGKGGSICLEKVAFDGASAGFTLTASATAYYDTQMIEMYLGSVASTRTASPSNKYDNSFFRFAGYDSAADTYTAADELHVVIRNVGFETNAGYPLFWIDAPRITDSVFALWGYGEEAVAAKMFIQDQAAGADGVDQGLFALGPLLDTVTGSYFVMKSMSAEFLVSDLAMGAFVRIDADVTYIGSYFIIADSAFYVFLVSDTEYGKRIMEQVAATQYTKAYIPPQHSSGSTVTGLTAVSITAANSFSVFYDGGANWTLASMFIVVDSTILASSMGNSDVSLVHKASHCSSSCFGTAVVVLRSAVHLAALTGTVTAWRVGYASTTVGTLQDNMTVTCSVVSGQANGDGAVYVAGGTAATNLVTNTYMEIVYNSEWCTSSNKASLTLVGTGGGDKGLLKHGATECETNNVQIVLGSTSITFTPDTLESLCEPVSSGSSTKTNAALWIVAGVVFGAVLSQA